MAEFLLTLLPGPQKASQGNLRLIPLVTSRVLLLNASLSLGRALEGFFCAKSVFPEQTSADFPHFAFLLISVAFCNFRPNGSMWKKTKDEGEKEDTLTKRYPPGHWACGYFRHETVRESVLITDTICQPQGKPLLMWVSSAR